MLMRQPGEWEVVEADLDGPRDHEMLVRMVASGEAVGFFPAIQPPDGGADVCR